MPLDTPFSVERDERVQRTSNAAPALSALDRAIADRGNYALQRSLDIVKLQREKDAHYIAPDGSRPRDVKEAGMGKPLTGIEVQRRLRKLSNALIFEDSPIPGRICVNYMASDPVLGHVKHNICSMERGLMPEFSVFNVLEEQVATMDESSHRFSGSEVKRTLDCRNPEIRGWRTVIAKVMRAGFVGQAGIERQFGTPSQTSKKWQEAICH